MESRRDEKCWTNGKLQSRFPIIHANNTGMSYPSQVWEGMRSYKQNDGTSKIYALREHVERLYASAKVMGLEITIKPIDVIQGAIDLVKYKGGGDLYLRPIVYENASCEGVLSANAGVSVDIYCFPLGKGYNEEGIKTAISSIPRGYPAQNMQAKAAMNYGTLGLYTKEAERLNVDAMLIPNFQGYIMESAVANLFIVKDGIIMTPCNNGDILPGITRKDLIQRIFLNPDVMFKKYHKNVQVVERNLTKADIYTADEIFLCGTFAEVTAVLEVDGRTIGKGRMGELTHLAKIEYEKMIRNMNFY